MYLPHRQHLAECNLKLTHTNIYNILCVYSIIHLQQSARLTLQTYLQYSGRLSLQTYLQQSGRLTYRSTCSTQVESPAVVRQTQQTVLNIISQTYLQQSGTHLIDYLQQSARLTCSSQVDRAGVYHHLTDLPVVVRHSPHRPTCSSQTLTSQTYLQQSARLTCSSQVDRAGVYHDLTDLPVVVRHSPHRPTCSSQLDSPVVVRQTQQVFIIIDSERHLIKTLVTAAAAETTAMIGLAKCLYHLTHIHTQVLSKVVICFNSIYLYDASTCTMYLPV